MTTTKVAPLRSSVPSAGPPYLSHERRTQLNTLHDLFADSMAGHSRICFVSGPLGSGKTELLRAFAAQAAATGALHVEATGSHSERRLPLGILEQLIRSGIRSGVDPEPFDDLLRNTHLLSGDPVHSDVARVLHRTCLALGELVEGAENGLIVSVDDADFADAESIRCLSLLARRMHGGRLFIVLSASGDHAAAESLLAEKMPSGSFQHRVHLPPLALQDTESFLAQQLGPEAARRLAPECHELSGGNPCLLNGLAEDNRGADENGPARPAVGTGYRQAVLSCLHHGGEETLAIAREVALLGSSADHLRPGALTGVGSRAARRAVTLLESSGILVDGDFRHPQARAAALLGLSSVNCAHLHSRAADLLFRMGAPIMSVAHHLLAAERPAPRFGVPVLQQAAEMALAEHRVSLALDCLRLALRTETGRRQDALTSSLLARAEWRTDPAVALRRVPTTSPDARGGTAAHQNAYTMRTLLWFGKASAATEALEALEAAGTPHAPNTAAQIAASRMWLEICYPETREATARPAGGEDCPGYGTSASGHLHAAALLTSALREGPGPRLVELAESLLLRYRFSEGNFGIVLAGLTTLVLCDRLLDAERWTAELGPEIEAANSPTWLAQLTALRAEISLRRNQLPSAVQQARRALTIIPYDSWGVVVGLPLSTLIQAHAALGTDHEEILAECLKGPWPDTICQTPAGLLVLYARARAHLMAGHQNVALDGFRTVGQMAVQAGIDIPALLPWRGDAARALLSLGQVAEARELAAAQLARCAPGQPRVRAQTLRVLAMASPPLERPRLLEQALTALRSAGDPRQLPHPLYGAIRPAPAPQGPPAPSTSDPHLPRRAAASGRSRRTRSSRTAPRSARRSCASPNWPPAATATGRSRGGSS
ncbi:AAA family ATPase [Streptomyces sp. P6-2-1]|uniref:AAA family ATPase n=1 Tax=Streptomyces sp. P6-2-1 TaxID=3422591 RepID=UPI003D360DA8